MFSSFSLTKDLWEAGQGYHAHFTDEATEVQKGNLPKAK
jgi:hypothetical protein